MIFMRIDVNVGEEIVFLGSAAIYKNGFVKKGRVTSVCENHSIVQTLKGDELVSERDIIAKVDRINGIKMNIVPYSGMFTVFHGGPSIEKFKTNETRIAT